MISDNCKPLFWDGFAHKIHIVQNIWLIPMTTTKELVEKYNALVEVHGPYSFVISNFLLDHDDAVLHKIAKLHRTTLRALLGDDYYAVEDRAVFLEDTEEMPDAKREVWPLQLLKQCMPSPMTKRPREISEYCGIIETQGAYSCNGQVLLDKYSHIEHFTEWARAFRLNQRCKAEMQGIECKVEDVALYQRDTPLAQRIIEEVRRLQK